MRVSRVFEVYRNTSTVVGSIGYYMKMHEQLVAAVGIERLWRLLRTGGGVGNVWANLKESEIVLGVNSFAVDGHHEALSLKPTATDQPSPLQVRPLIGEEKHNTASFLYSRRSKHLLAYQADFQHTRSIFIQDSISVCRLTAPFVGSLRWTSAILDVKGFSLECVNFEMLMG
ncbi:unnamed protein product [Larinioides sclopetarius]|uniref:Uncharacterized protein n=1 Tax=Larinioides sclopetarius TaxID=280406 RepID=A0AAV1YQI6_9ARAC